MTAVAPKVDAIFSTYPPPARAKIMELRSLILTTATAENVGEIEETLRWGQPSYLTAPKIGSTIRLGWSKKSPDRVSVYFICTTRLVGRFHDIYPDTFTYDSGRAIHFTLSEKIPATELSHCFAIALTYHRNKK
ncbi:MAG: DUF1801 domain-containing protein [Paracoccaceae bacterium]